MNVICIDDEYLILQRTVLLLRKFPQVEHAVGFLRGQEALEYMKHNRVDAVFADINMPEMDGLELAAAIRASWPETAIVFLTAYNEFAVSAFRVRANGYLLKPVEKELLEEEIKNIECLLKHRALSGESSQEKLATIQTFGNFAVITENGVISFARQRSKEILAYLVCKNGTGVSRAELAGILWEDALYDHSKQKQLDVYIRTLMTALRDRGIEEIVEMKGGQLRIRPETVDCDYYRYRAGDPEAVRQYSGEFMNNYSWAEYLKPVFDK